MQIDTYIINYDDFYYKEHAMQYSLTDLEIKNSPNGSVVKILKNTDHTFAGFGEIYFSFIEKDKIKGWKKHLKYSLNLVVVRGAVTFAFFDNGILGNYYTRFPPNGSEGSGLKVAHGSRFREKGQKIKY